MSLVLSTSANPGTAAWVDASLAGAGGTLPMHRSALVDPDAPGAADDGSLSTPFITIQAALDAFEAAATALSGGTNAPYTQAAQQEPWIAIVAQGEYDEDLTVPSGLVIALAARGSVCLGTAGARFAPTNARNITWEGNTTRLPATYNRPALILTVWGGPGIGNDFSTIAVGAGTWQIGGQILLVDEAGGTGFGAAGAALFLRETVVYDNTAGTGSILDTGATGSVLECYFYDSEMVSAVSLATLGGNVVLASRSIFDALNLGVGLYGLLSECRFSGAVAAGSGYGFTAEGLVSCDFGLNQIWTGDLVCDDYTLYRATTRSLSVTGGLDPYRGTAYSIFDADPGNGGTFTLSGEQQFLLAIGAGAETSTLPDPNYIGQEIVIATDTVGGGSRAISNANGFDAAANTTITLSTTFAWVKLKSIHFGIGKAVQTYWRVIASEGAILSP